MDNILRQLLDMINSVPAPGHEPPAVQPQQQYHLSNSSVPLQNLGRVGGTETGVANRLPPMVPNGMGSYEPAPQDRMAPPEQQPPFDPSQTYINRGAPWQQRTPEGNLVGIQIGEPQIQRGGLSPQEGIPEEEMMITRGEPSRGRHIQFSEKTTPMQPRGHQGPVHLHLDSDVLQALIKHKGAPTAEGE